MITAALCSTHPPLSASHLQSAAQAEVGIFFFAPSFAPSFTPPFAPGTGLAHPLRRDGRNPDAPFRRERRQWVAAGIGVRKNAATPEVLTPHHPSTFTSIARRRPSIGVVRALAATDDVHFRVVDLASPMVGMPVRWFPGVCVGVVD